MTWMNRLTSWFVGHLIEAILEHVVEAIREPQEGQKP